LRLNWPCCAILKIPILNLKSTSTEDRIAHCNKILIIPSGDNLFCCGSSPAGILLCQMIILTVKVPVRVNRQGKEKHAKRSTAAGRWMPGGPGSPVWSGQQKVADAE